MNPEAVQVERFALDVSALRLRASVLLPHLFCAVLLCGCESEATEPSDSPVESSSATVAPGRSSSAPAASSNASPKDAAPVLRQAQAIFVAPTERTPKPTPEEWKSAKLVNTAEADASTKCTMSVVREWVGIFCDDHVQVIAEASFGKPRTDYDSWGKSPGLAFRLRKGHVAEASIRPLKSGYHAFLWAAWPSTTDGPVALSLRNSRHEQKWLETEGVPDVSGDKARRPAEADWVLAAQVNTPQVGGHDLCRLLTLAGWIKLRCMVPFADGYSGVSGFRNLHTLGKKAEHYFLRTRRALMAHEVRELEFPLRRGLDGKIDIVLFRTPDESERLKFRVRWPEDEDRPDVLAIEKVE